ncbi:MAG TPA: hypothetical protein VF652_03480 [Allosphingosinicella sp.]|jgi:hypothetical protein
MRPIAFLLLLLMAAVPAAAQPLTATLDALRRDFPLDHQPIAASLAGKSPEESRSLTYAGVESFLRARGGAILAAPGPTLRSIESRQAALLRDLARRDPSLCAKVGDRGFFSREALAGAAPAELDAYGAALVEAAKAGAGAAPAANLATKEDFLAWLAAVDRIEPGVPVRAMLMDPALRAKSSPDHLCRGAVAMHLAVGALAPGPGERVARTLLSSVIAAAGR